MSQVVFFDVLAGVSDSERKTGVLVEWLRWSKDLAPHVNVPLSQDSVWGSVIAKIMEQ